MRFEPMVVSLLDTDLYKFNMGQIIFHRHRDLVGEYHFRCRSRGIVFSKEMLAEINAQLEHLCTLRFTADELNTLAGLRRYQPDYLSFLRQWQPPREAVSLSLSQAGELCVIVKGQMAACMLFETYLLATINETYFRCCYDEGVLVTSARERMERKVQGFRSGRYTFPFTEFGCRRRLSRAWEEEALARLLDTGCCTGTSNVYLAARYNIPAVGTCAHEYVQLYQGLGHIPLAYANRQALVDWYDEYKGENSIALTDTLTTDLFLLDFDRAMADRFAGVRHDSGDPYSWAQRLIAHYRQLGIDPRSKLLLFSNSLNFDKAQALYDAFHQQARVAFGIGTYCSNDTCVPPLNIVIKLQYVDGRPVAKLSDEPGKAMCQDRAYLARLKQAVMSRLSAEQKMHRDG